MIESLDERDAFVAVNVAGTDFLRRVIAGTANTEFHAGRVIVKVVDSIVDAIILAVSSWGALRRSLEAAVLDCIIITILRMPLEVIAKDNALRPFAARFSLGSQEDRAVNPGARRQNDFSDRRIETPPRKNLRLVPGGEVRPVALRGFSIADRISVFGFVFSVDYQRNLVQKRQFWEPATSVQT